MATAAATRSPTVRVEVPKKAPANLINTLGGAIDTMWLLREQKRTAELAVKVIEEKITAAEEDIMARLDVQGLDSAKGKDASVSVTSATVANVEDWPAFHAYIAKNKFFHLLQKRVSDPAYRELLDMGKKVPGVSPFNKKKLTLRSIAA